MKMIEYKFNEDKLIQELQEYVDSTYDGHYATDKYQATDIICDAGYGMGFLLGNVIKYAKRYGKKGDITEHKKDLMKILHYALIALNEHRVEGDRAVRDKITTRLDYSDCTSSDFNKIEISNTSSNVEYYYPNGTIVPTATVPRKTLNDVTEEEWNEVSRRQTNAKLR
jgi:hypothetical protein